MNASSVIVKQPPTPSTEDVRRILNAWSRTGFLRVRRLGDRVQIEEIQTLACYTVRLQSQYEERSISQALRPYHGGEVDDRGQPPGTWDIPVPPPEDFEDRTEKRPVPHTEQVQNCGACGGFGKVNCGRCSGWGKITCTSCSGNGYRMRTEFRTTQGPNGMQTETVQVRDNCSCFGGKVNCPQCIGHGKITCGTCTGTGRVVHYDLLTVKFRAATQTEVVNKTPIPEARLKQAAGDVLVDERADRIDAAPTVLPEVDALTDGLLQKSHEESHGDTRLHFQRLHVEQVGVQEVRYRYAAGQSRRLWIYGTADSIHAPGAPRAWIRLIALVGGIAAAMAAVGYLVL